MAGSHPGALQHLTQLHRIDHRVPESIVVKVDINFVACLKETPDSLRPEGQFLPAITACVERCGSMETDINDRAWAR